MKAGAVAGLTAVTILATAGCGSTNPPSTTGPTGGPGTFNVSGTLTLRGGSDGQFNGDVCNGTDGFEDIATGAQIIVRDASGKQVGLGDLGIGFFHGKPNGPLANCRFDFVVQRVAESGTGIYSIQVANRGQFSFKRADSESLKLSLG